MKSTITLLVLVLTVNFISAQKVELDKIGKQLQGQIRSVNKLNKDINSFASNKGRTMKSAECEDIYDWAKPMKNYGLKKLLERVVEYDETIKNQDVYSVVSDDIRKLKNSINNSISAVSGIMGTAKKGMNLDVNSSLSGRTIYNSFRRYYGTLADEIEKAKEAYNAIVKAT